ncbi:MAG: hypothetical protein AAFY00_10985, partial [Bacteroidota bacterium]
MAYDRDFGKHSINASAVFEQFRLRIENTSISDFNEISPDVPEAFSPDARATSFSVPQNLNSVLFLGGYEYDNRYILSGSARRDASSRFSVENDNFADWFFSGSAGWNVSNEPWFNVDAINSLKFRASYGQSGNNATGRGPASVNAFSNTLGVNLPAALNDEIVSGISPNNAANPDLRWETQIKQNYGFDAAFLYDQIQIGVDYFQNRSEDLLVPVQLPSSSGIPGNPQQGATVIRNAGDVEVKGWDITLAYNDYKGKFKWNFWGNVTTNQSEVLSTGPVESPLLGTIINPPFAQPLNRSIEGEAPFSFFGLVADGVFSTQEQIDAELPNNSSAAVPVQPGDVRFRDLNGDGLITVEGDRTIIGNPNPDFTYSFNLRAEYNGWDFDILFNGVQGVDILNTNTF